jgi:hypothetical protein
MRWRVERPEVLDEAARGGEAREREERHVEVGEWWKKPYLVWKNQI